METSHMNWRVCRLLLVASVLSNCGGGPTTPSAPTRVGASKKLQSGCVMNTMTGLEPAGACTVRVANITITAAPSARLSAQTCGPKDLRKSRPINELST